MVMWSYCEKESQTARARVARSNSSTKRRSDTQITEENLKNEDIPLLAKKVF